MSKENNILIRNLSFSYSENSRTVLSKFNLEMQKGELLSILGISGSGKSTLLAILSNLQEGYSITDGKISIFDNNPKEYHQLGRTSFIFQESNLMPNLTVRENIEFPMILRDEIIDKDYIEDLLNLVDLKEYENYMPKNLSGGMKARTALIRSFVIKPELLLLDEPFSSLDISWRLEVYEYLNKIKSKYNTTVILVSHDIHEAILLSDKIVVLGSHGGIKLARSVTKTKNIEFFEETTINSHIKSNQELFLDIQSEIIRDSRRSKLELDEILISLKRLEVDDIDYAYKHNTKQKNEIVKLLKSIKKQVENEDVFDLIWSFWEKSSNIELKYQILWVLLNKSDFPKSKHETLKNFFLQNIISIKNFCVNDGFSSENSIEKYTIDRLNDNSFVDSKKWIYPYYYKAVKGNEFSQSDLIFIKNLLKSKDFATFPLFSEYVSELIKSINHNT